jgi:hypothetical protein
MLSSAQNLNQNDDITKEFQAILLYYCNKILLHNSVNNHNDLNGHHDFSSNEFSSIEETAQNICKWTEDILSYQRKDQKVTHLKFADDLVLELPKKIIAENTKTGTG